VEVSPSTWVNGSHERGHLSGGKASQLIRSDGINLVGRQSRDLSRCKLTDFCRSQTNDLSGFKARNVGRRERNNLCAGQSIQLVGGNA
jgi:hypothetical protein